MRILDRSSDKSIDRVTLYLTRAEASELRDSLKAILAGPAERHEHVLSPDCSKEITVCIYDASSLNSFDQRSRKLIVENE